MPPKQQNDAARQDNGAKPQNKAPRGPKPQGQNAKPADDAPKQDNRPPQQGNQPKQDNRGPHPPRGPKPQQADPEEAPTQHQQQQSRPPKEQSGQARQQSQKPAAVPGVVSSSLISLAPSPALEKNLTLCPILPSGKTNTENALVTVSANLYPVTINTTTLETIYQYDVSFDQELTSKHAQRKEIYNLLNLAGLLEYFAYDNECNLFSPLQVNGEFFLSYQQLLQIDDNGVAKTKYKLYNEFGEVIPVDKIKTGLADPKIKIRIRPTTSHSLVQSIQSSKEIQNTTIWSASDLHAACSTLFRHFYIVFICHSERNRIRKVIEASLKIKDTEAAKFWSAGDGANIRILLSTEWFVSRHGSIYRLDRPEFVRPLCDGLNGIVGAYSALKVLQSGIFLNVSHTVLPTFLKDKPVLDLLKEIAGTDRSGRPNPIKERHYHQIRKYRAVTTHLPHGNTKISLQMIGPEVGKVPTFTDSKTNKSTSVLQYFKTTYNINLDPNLLTFVVKKQGKVDASGKRGPEVALYYPVEILKVYSLNNQPKKDLTGPQTRALLEVCTKRPSEYFKETTNQLEQLQRAITYVQQQTNNTQQVVGILNDLTPSALSKVAHHGPPGSVYTAFGLTRAAKTTTARVLPPPHAVFGGNKSVAAQGGAFNARDFQFFQPAAPTEVIVAQFSNYSPRQGTLADVIQKYQKDIIAFSEKKGLILVPVADKSLNHVNTRPVDNGLMTSTVQWCRQIAQYAQDKKVLILFVCDANSNYYSTVKRTCAHNAVGIVSQCAESNKLCATYAKGDSAISSYVGNIVLKINTKLGGINYSLAPQKPDHNPVLQYKQASVHKTLSSTVPVSVFGIDVYHSPAQRSHAGIVSSFDSKLTQYNGFLVQQAKNRAVTVSREILLPETIQKAFCNLLIQFSDINKKGFPSHIVIYRDGVSDSQLAQSMDDELPGIIAGCQQAYLTVHPTSDLKYSPTISYIVAAKRHHVVFLPKDTSEASCDKFGKAATTENVKAGTVVDSGIVRSDLNEFYLQSHASMLGTGRNTLYQLLFCSNPKNITFDALQLLTYYLSYNCQRSLRATRVNCAIQFADLLCYHGRYFDPEYENFNSKGDGTWKIEELPPNLRYKHFWL